MWLQLSRVGRVCKQAVINRLSANSSSWINQSNRHRGKQRQLPNIRHTTTTKKRNRKIKREKGKETELSHVYVIKETKKNKQIGLVFSSHGVTSCDQLMP